MGSPTVRRLGAACLLLALLAGGGGVARAAEGKGDYVGAWSVAAFASFAIPNTDAYENAFAWRVAAGYNPTPQFNLDVEAGGFSVAVKQREANGIPSYTIASGDLTVHALSLTFRWFPPLPESYVTSYLLAGIGYYGVRYGMADRSRQVFEASGVAGLPDQKVSDSWGMHAGAGFEYPLFERLSLVGEGRYIFLRPGASGTALSGGRINGSINLNTWLLTGGIRVAF